MNRGAMQSSPVQQMMAVGNPNWWNINTMRPPLPTHPQQQPPSHFLSPSPITNFFSPPHPPPSLHVTSWHDNQELPQSWSQLLMGGLMGGEEQELSQASNSNLSVVDDHVKQENPANETSYVYGHTNEDFHRHEESKSNWSQQLMAAASSPKSCITSFSSNMLEFSGNKPEARQRFPDQSSECNSSAASGGALKKARVQASANQSTTIKVRKEKLGDRITALHQLVSPFGKTDTASVLLEAIGYIRFLHSQIEALSLPYLNGGSGNIRQQQPLLNENSMKRKRGPDDQQDFPEEPKKDLRSRGLCLVPVSCMHQVGSDNGADYWAPTFGDRFR